MIITRSPLRISLGGGGTDLPSYYRQHGGSLIAAAIDKYVYVTVMRPFTPGIFLKYSKLEHVEQPDEVQHPIIREALKLTGTGLWQIEITTLADIPAGTGLGSSGSFTTALLRALSAFHRKPIHSDRLAELACDIEINRLKEPIGKQDQYIAAYGGVSSFTFKPDDSVDVKPVTLSQHVLHRLEDHLLLFFTGYSRSAGSILADQQVKTAANDAEMVANLHYVKELGARSLEALESGDLATFGGLMHEHWEHKKARSRGMTNPQIDEWYQLALKSGAKGGKLVGAGGGGFLLFYAEDTARLRAAMRGAGLDEVRFRFDYEGTKGPVFVILPVAILAGGLATRLRPLTDEVPKSLVEVAGRPFAEHQLELLRNNGITDVVFCVGHLGAQIQQTLGDGSQMGLQISYVDDGPQLMGTGGALLRAVPRLGPAFLVMYGDSYLPCDYGAVASTFLSSKKRGLMTVFRNANQWERSNVRFDGKNILGYDKAALDPAFEYVDYGLGALRAEALENYPAEERLDLAQVYADLVREGQLAAFEVHERFYEMGSLSGLTELRAKLSSSRVS